MPPTWLQQLALQWDNGMVTFGFGKPPADPQARQQRIEVMYEQSARQFPGVRSISVSELMQLQQSQPVMLLDVRSPQEQSVSRLPGAISVTEFEPQRDVGQAIVVYCTIGYRSGLFAQTLQQQGVPVQNLRGSILAWTYAGGQFVTPDGTSTHQVHTYGKRWDLLAPGYKAVW